MLALGGSAGASFLAVAVLASNMSLLLASVRSTPDALLCLCLSLSLFGFLRLVALGDRQPSAYALAYLGAGLAVAAKGFLGLLPVAFSFLFCALGRRRGAPAPRTLVHVPLMLAGAAIGLCWFVAVLLEHGAVAWNGFFADQIGGKVEASRVRALGNVPRYLLAALQHFLPWSALAGAAWLLDRRGAPAGDRRERLVELYALGFLSIAVLVFAAGRDMRPRYLLPAYPLLAVALAPWLERRFADPARVLARWLRGAVAIAGVGGGLALAAAGLALHPRIAAAGLTLAAGAALVIVASRRGWRHAVAGTALLLVFALPLHDLLVSPVFKTQPARLAAARIAALDPAPARVVLLGLGGEYAGLLSLHLQGRVAVVTANEAPPPGASAAQTVVVATGPHRDDLLARGYRLEPCGFLLRRWTGRDLVRALRQGGAAFRPQDARIPVYLALGG